MHSGWRQQGRVVGLGKVGRQRLELLKLNHLLFNSNNLAADCRVGAVRGGLFVNVGLVRREGA